MAVRGKNIGLYFQMEPRLEYCGRDCEFDPLDLLHWMIHGSDIEHGGQKI